MVLLEVFNFLFYCYYFFVGIKDAIQKKLCNKKDSIEIDEVFLITDGIYTRIKNEDVYNDWMMYNVNKTSILKVYYIVTLDNKQFRYVVFYKYPEKIYFPPYSLDEIKYSQHNKILFAETDDKDITGLCKVYAGPLENFYRDLPYTYIQKNLICETEDKITVTYSNMSDYLIET